MSLRHTPTARDLLVAEVLHLHAIWRRGPPPRPSSPLLLANPPAFKKQSAAKITKKQSKKKNKKEDEQQPNPSAASTAENEWPCPLTPIPTTTGTTDWKPFPPPSAAPPLSLPSVEDLARAAAAKVQVSAIKSCEEFFAGGDDDTEEDEEDEGNAMDEDGDGSKIGAFKFFLGLFEKDGELRDYYEKNFEDGYFSCLVCLGIGAKKKGRKFRNCVGLVQHANAIFKTRTKGAHRGFARAVCRVLGWNMERLPSIVLDLADPLGKSLIKADGTKEDVKEAGTEEVANKLENCGEDLMESVPKSDIDPLLMEIVEEEPSKEVAGVVEDHGENMVKSVEQSEADQLSMEVVEEACPKKVPGSVEDRGENPVKPKKVPDSVEDRGEDPVESKKVPDSVEDRGEDPVEFKKVPDSVEDRGEDSVESKKVPDSVEDCCEDPVESKKVPDSVEDRGENSVESIEQTEENQFSMELLEEERFKEVADVMEVENLIKSVEQSEADQLLVEKDVTEDAANLPKESAKLVLANTDNIAMKELVAGSPNKNVLIGERVDIVMEGGGNMEPNNGT